ncbi:MAG: carboxypeptidase regulatory-like domain-containing protein [Terracidiphilus sp.]
MNYFSRFATCCLVAASLLLPAAAVAQTAALHGQVADPSGAVIPGAAISLTGGVAPIRTQSGADGEYAIRGLTPGSYTISVTASGFAPLTIPYVTLNAGQSKSLNLPLAIAVEKQEVQVQGETQSVGLSSEQNASATVIKGSALDALSDDPTELQNELQALAGPAAGPNGGQIYIDGFEGGQIPPKADILEIRVNQNPFSAEYDRIGYGRIEIITKPGTQKLHGVIGGWGTSSALGTANPFLAGQPSYYQIGNWDTISGPISKTASYFFSATNIHRQNQSIVNALDPATLNSNIIEPFSAPMEYFALTPRVDFQITKTNFVSVRDQYARYSAQGLGVGSLVLPEQATGGLNWNNDVQIGDTWVINPHLLMEPRFLWRRIGNNTTSSLSTPTVTVQGAFTTGGNGVGTLHDHQDVFMLQNYGTATVGPHTLRFGARARAYRDADYSTANVNGNYFFNCALTSPQCANSYQAGTPEKYSATEIENPLARALLFDGSLFMQDDWRVNRSFLLGLGMRYEGQNYIHDRDDWAPRIAFAWTPGHPGKTPPKTVIRAGYGWFFNRFIMNTAFNSGSEPYIITAIHDNRINQQSYTITNPNTVFPSYPFNSADPAPIPASVLATAPSSIPTYHSVDPHFHAALDMQTGIGVDRQIARHVTGNVTYLFTQGVHQYMSNNVTAPVFDVSDYTIAGSTPSVYNYQFQSEGFYRQNQLIVSSALQLKKFTVSGNYVLNEAKSDTQGINSFPSVAQDPGLDYGRASFGMRQRFLAIGSYTAPHGFVLGAYIAAQSGTPYNLTIGEDLTGNNQFNARPTYGTCGDPGVITTQYGCLDSDPVGKDEPMIPYGVGLGPANAIVHVRISKVFGIGPRIKTAAEGQSFTVGGGNVSSRGIGSGGPSIRLDATAPRRYNLTLIAGANDVFNMVNLGTPNGVLLSPLFNQTQSLAAGQFGSATPGTRSITFQSTFTF